MFVFAGLGVGVGYDGDNPDFELIPRAGLNVAAIGRSGVLTPEVTVPIKIGESFGEDGDVGTDVGLMLGVGFTTTF